MKTQPLLSDPHDVTLPPEFEQKVALPPPTQPLGAGSHVQVPLGFKPVHVVCVGQVTVDATKKQPSPSTSQLDFVEVVAQKVAVADPQFGSTLQLQVAAPAVPPQVVCEPQATAAPVAKKQPFPSTAQVVRVLPPEQITPVTPAVWQTPVLHVHAALEPAAAQVECAPQATAVPQTGHEFVSSTHV
jgi:hypothetical protein